ncbi:MAG: preprotein translocase subunit YajC [Clostridiales bacterium]
MGQYGSLIWIVVMVAMMYFLILRPQKKQQKERTTMMDSLKKGDRVVTIGGIHGIVRGIKEDRITLEIASEVYVHFAKSAIGSILRSETKASKAPEPEVLSEEDMADADYVIDQDQDDDQENR